MDQAERDTRIAWLVSHREPHQLASELVAMEEQCAQLRAQYESQPEQPEPPVEDDGVEDDGVEDEEEEDPRVPSDLGPGGL